MGVSVSLNPQPRGAAGKCFPQGVRAGALQLQAHKLPGTQRWGGKTGVLVYFVLEVVGGGSGWGSLPQLASALGVTPLQRFPVEAEDVL